jgi:O-antigen/teichoic acid export membrane protein
MRSENFADKVQSEGVTRRVVKGGLWVFLLRATERGVSLARLVIVARLLVPYDFGVLGIALLTATVLDTFSQTGFHSALIQKKQHVESYLNSAWTVIVMRGFAIFAVLYFIAPSVASFFGVPESKSVIRVIGLAGVMQAFTNIGIIHFQKDLEFNKFFTYRMSGTIADFCVTVPLAFFLKNVWALVFGMLVGNLVRCIVSYMVHQHRPRFNLELEKVRELFTFGKWILGSSAMIFLINQGDDILVGKLLGATLLGLYQMAFTISNVPAAELSVAFSEVTFPAYSKLQDSPERLRQGFVKTLQLTSLVSIPLAAGLTVLAPDLTMIFLGEKWMPMVPALRVLAVYGMLRALGTANISLFRGSGNPQVDTRLQFARLLIFAILLYPLTRVWGIVGASMAVFISGLAVFGPQVINALRMVGLEYVHYWRGIGVAFISALLASCIVWIVKPLIQPVGLAMLVSLSAGALVLYGSAVMFFDRYLAYGALKTVRELLVLIRE